MKNISHIHIIRLILFAVLSLILLSPAITATVSAESADASSGFGAAHTLAMPENGKLKIAVFSDIQDTQSVSSDLIHCMEKILDEQKPNLMVFLGDQVEGYNPWVHLGNNEKHVKKIIDKILAPVVKRGLDFAVVFGNHDSRDAGVSKESQMAYYSGFPGCLAADDGSLPGCGTYDLVYTNRDGSPALHLYFADSGEYSENGGYANLTEEQTEWYLGRAEALKTANNGNTVPGFFFQHIIVPEIYKALQPSDKSDSAVKGHGVWEDSYWTAPDDGSFSGTLGESPCPPDESGEFSAWKKGNDIVAAFFGHDHKNSFVARYDNVDLVACPGMTYASYNSSAARGVRMIEISSDGSYETKVLSFNDYEESGVIAVTRRITENPWVTLGIAVIVPTAAIITATVIMVKKLKKKLKSSAALTAR